MINRIISQVNIPPEELDIPQGGAPNSGDVSTVLSIAFALAASVALIILIIAGIQFMTSRGDPQKVATARNTIIYAVIGLVVAASAFAIVTFVLGSI